MRIDFNSSRVITCPFCFEKKYFMNCLSCNDVGARYWSDGKRNGPMLPEMSNVQKCSRCGKYYLRSRQQEQEVDDFNVSDDEPLTYQELKEAFVQLSAEGFDEEGEEEADIRFMLHYAHNDYYHREEKRPVSEEESKFFRDNALWLIRYAIDKDILKVEFYREIGEFEMAQKCLDIMQDTRFLWEDFANEIERRIKEKDSEVFFVSRHKDRRRWQRQ